MSRARDHAERLHFATPASFGSDIVPSKHLKQFSCRRAGVGTTAKPGAVTCAAGAVTAVATGVAGINYSTSTTRVLIEGDGSGAVVEITGVGGSGEITGYTVVSGGSGYTEAVAYVVDGPVVVVVGDSIAAEQPNPSNLGASQWYMLCSAIQAANPSRNIAFFNRAIGSQTWTSFNGTPSSSWPDWYVDNTRPWMDYIEDLQPDLVIIALGMNDAENFVFSQCNAAIADLLAFDTTPDIVLVTPMVPHATSDTPSISDADAQIGRDAVAGYLRGMALTNNFGFVDLNRRLRLVRDGLDVRRCALRLSSSAASALPWTAAETSEGDFSLDMTFTTFTLSGNTLTITLGMDGENTRTELLIDDNGGYVRCKVWDIEPDGLATTTQDTVTSGLATPTGTVGIDVIVLDQRLIVLVNDTVVYAEHIKRYSGEFSPMVSYTAAESPTIIYSRGRYARYASRMADVELWGESAGGDYQGNELNHPSALAVATVIAPAIWETEWAHSPMTIGGDSAGVTTNVGIGEVDPLGRLHATKLRIDNASRVTPAATANTIVAEDDTAPGISLLSGASGVARIVAGDIANQSQFSLAYSHSSDTLTQSIGGSAQVSLTANQQTLAVPFRPYSGTVAQISALTGMTEGAMAYCTNEGGGAALVIYTSATWVRVDDGSAMTT